MTTTPEAYVKPAVEEALASIARAFPGIAMTTVPDEQGGLWVEMQNIQLGPPYVQDSTFLAFLLPYALPAADIYPMFVRPDLARVDGGELGLGFGVVQMQWPPGSTTQRQVVQLSRVTKAQAFTSQTAAQKVVKVIDWLMTR